MKNSLVFIGKKKITKIKSDIDKNIFVAEIDGAEIRSWADYWDAVSSAFSFPELPSYLKSNYHTYYDMMTDLSWVREENIILIINNADDFLKEDLRLKNSIIKDFQEYLLPFWENEVDKTVVNGKSRYFSIYFVTEDRNEN